MKPCSKCKKTKPLDEFSPLSNGPQGHRSRCKPCCNQDNRVYKAANLDKTRRGSRESAWRRYGIILTLAEYDVMVEEQQGLCLICQRPDSTGKSLAVDHDKESGRIRGLLCDLCNRGIGMLRHDPKNLTRAIEYLEGS